MAAVESFTEKMQRARREQGRNWTLADEAKWLESHPDDEPLTIFTAKMLADLKKPDIEHDEDLVPDIEAYEENEEDVAVDAILNRIGIVEAYNRWANKGEVKNPGNRTEGIKVRCPSPAHVDAHPSAWLNTDRDLWVCGGCGMEGGDKYDIAAWRFGFDVPGYKTGKKFPDLRRQMAVDLGYTVKHNKATGQDTASKVAPDVQRSATEVPVVSPEPNNEGHANHIATVSALHPTVPPEPMDPATAKSLHIDWRTLADENRFLREWMNATTVDDLPEEYHFWTGLIALGLAVGNDISLEDYNQVYANLFITIIGGTGAGKSRSVSHLTRVLNEALPYRADDPANSGTNIIKGVGSGEALIDSFVELHEDTGEPYTVPVRGLMHFDELSSLVGKSANSGSILKPVLMEFYDKSSIISTKSRSYGSAQATDAFGSCVTTTQPNSLRRLVSYEDADSGFLNRWVFVWGVPKERVAYGGQQVDLERAAIQLRGVKSWAAQHRPLAMKLEGEALAAWEDFFHRVIVPNTGDTYVYEDDLNEAADALLGRIALLFKKLIVLFAIDRKELTPSVRTVLDAVSLWEYVQSTYRMVGVSLITNEHRELEDAVLRLIEKYAKEGRTGPRRSAIADALKTKYSREDVKRAIKTLEEIGTIEEVTWRDGNARGPSKTAMVIAGQ